METIFLQRLFQLRKAHKLTQRTSSALRRARVDTMEKLCKCNESNRRNLPMCGISSLKAARFYEEHSGEIFSCQSAKRYFNAIGMKQPPSIQLLKQKYAVLLTENKKLYPEFKQTRAKMIELMTAKNNTDCILGLSANQEKQRDRQREDGRNFPQSGRTKADSEGGVSMGLGGVSPPTCRPGVHRALLASYTRTYTDDWNASPSAPKFVPPLCFSATAVMEAMPMPKSAQWTIQASAPPMVFGK